MSLQIWSHFSIWSKKKWHQVLSRLCVCDKREKLLWSSIEPHKAANQQDALKLCMHTNRHIICTAGLNGNKTTTATVSESTAVSLACRFFSSSSISLHLLLDKVKIILKHIICSNITEGKVIKWKNEYFIYIFCMKEARTKERKKKKNKTAPIIHKHTHLSHIGFSSTFYSHDVIVRALHIDVFTFDD